jgi:hypothetical protein
MPLRSSKGEFPFTGLKKPAFRIPRETRLSIHKRPKKKLSNIQWLLHEQGLTSAQRQPPQLLQQRVLFKKKSWQGLDPGLG